MARMCTIFGLILLLSSSIAASDSQWEYRQPRDFVFPGPISARPPADEENKVVKSIELAKRISLADNEQEFLNLIGISSPSISYSLSQRFGGIRERSHALIAKPAKCQPETVTVPVKENPEPDTIYYPTCIRVKRCGGCCNHEALACQPNNTETRHYRVTVIKLEDKIPQQEIVPIDEHLECHCDCAVKAKDCIEKQYYDQHGCRCVCKNKDEEEKCRLQGDQKYWNQNECACKCRNIEECATGFYFDQNICSCKGLPLSKLWFSNENRRPDYNNYDRQPVNNRPKETPPVIVTLDAKDPRRKQKDDPEYK